MNIQIFGRSKCFDTKKAERWFKERRVRFQSVFQHLAYDQDKLDRLWEDQTMLRTPIVRNGRQATVGYCPEVWAAWE